jgi:quinol monooxygenase YgiN
MIYVVVKIVTKPGQRDVVLQAFRNNVPAVRAEKGRIEYSTFADASGVGSLPPTGCGFWLEMAASNPNLWM